MRRNWELIETSRIYSNCKISVPDEILSDISYNHRFDDLCVEWHIDDLTDRIVLSNKQLDTERFSNAGRTKVFKKNGYIRPRNTLLDDWGKEFSKGDLVVYLTHKRMEKGVTRALYLMTREQCFELIDDNPESEESLVRKLKEAFN
jgi:hypothetical protein